MRRSREVVPHQPLTCANTVYIGKAAPYAAHDGLDAVQKPLAELYTKNDKQSKLDDHNCTAYIFTSGILMRPVNRLDKEVWFRMQDLESCSAVKAYNNPNYGGRLQFVPIDSEQGAMSPHHPIFNIVTKRATGGLKLSDCHAFVCFSEEAAMALVHACAFAYGNPCGWAEEQPTLVELGLQKPDIKIDNERYVDDVKDTCSPEFYEKPSLKGFFYTPRSDLIQKYDIGGEDAFGRLVPNYEPIEHFTCEPEPQEEPTCGAGQQTVCIQPLNYVSPYVQPGQMIGQNMVTSVQPMIAPQQPQMYYGGGGYGEVDMGKYAKQQIKAEKKAEKKARKKNKHQYVQENEYMTQLPQGQYIMDPSCGDCSREVMALGRGDNGPPPENIYSHQLPVQGNGRKKEKDGNFILRKGAGYNGGKAYGVA